MDKFQIETAQNVNIHQNVAGIGDRILAYLIDFLIMAAYAIIVSILFSSFDMLDDFTIIVGATIGLPLFLYHLVWEQFWNGRSPGKAVLNLRVVKIDGTKPSFSNFLLRWILRIIDISTTSGAIALFTILLNGKGQRLGDIAATTTVISENKTVDFSEMLHTEIPENYTPTYSQVTVFSDSEMQTIKNLFIEAKRKGNHNVILKLSNKVSKVMDITFTGTPIQFLDIVIKDYNYYTQNM